jgi:cadmium resistance protein CadD (predicted permease)
MQELLAIIAITGATFIATSFDNLVLLVGFLGDREYRKSRVFLGYVAAATIVAALAWGLSEVVDEAPARYMAYLVAGKGALSVGSVMLASSGDTFSALIAVFADTADRYTVPMLATVALAALCWCGLAAWLRSHPVLERPLSNLARYVIPFLLIGIGIYILMDSGTDVVVG